MHLRKFILYLKIDFYSYITTKLKSDSSNYITIAKKMLQKESATNYIDILNSCALRKRSLNALSEHSLPNNFTIMLQYAKLYLISDKGDLAFQVLENYLIINKKFSFLQKIRIIDVLKRLIAYFPGPFNSLEPRIKAYLTTINESYKSSFLKRNSILSKVFLARYDHLLHMANQLNNTTEAMKMLNIYLRSYNISPLSLKNSDGALNINNFKSKELINHQHFLGTISIIMPAKNVAKYIESAINSVLRQTYPYWELIIIDDASTDDTYRIINNMTLQENRIICIKSELAGGAGNARRTGMQKANGKYLMFHDADDFAHPSRLEIMVESINRNKKLVAITHQYVRLGMDGKFFSHIVWPYTRTTPISMIIHKNEVLDRIGYMQDVGIGEDSEYWQRLILAFGNKRVSSINLPLLIASHRQNSLLNATGLANGEEYFFNKKQYNDWELWSENLLQQAINIVKSNTQPSHKMATNQMNNKLIVKGYK